MARFIDSIGTLLLRSPLSCRVCICRNISSRVCLCSAKVHHLSPTCCGQKNGTPKGAALLSQGRKKGLFRLNCPWWHSIQTLSFWGSGEDRKQQSLGDIAQSIQEKKYKRIVVMAGAGISTPSGIPDFRSPGSGLYDNLQQYDLPYAEAIFEINFFHHNPRPFFALAKELYPGNYQPNLTHYFVRLLHDKGQLLRMYTQNIDGLERLAGIPPERLVEAHGTFATATCTVCRRNYEGRELRSDVMRAIVPKCPTCKGVVKPDIVFFGEELPQHFFKYIKDFPLADLLIVMGTSLEVEPFASLAGAVRSTVPRLLINRDLVGPFAWGTSRPIDVAQIGDVVSGVRALVDTIGWTQELETLMAECAEKVRGLL